MRAIQKSGRFKKLADEVLKFVDSSKPKRLIVDLRQNTGGDLKKDATAISLIKEARRYYHASEGAYMSSSDAPSTSKKPMATAI